MQLQHIHASLEKRNCHYSIITHKKCAIEKVKRLHLNPNGLCQVRYSEKNTRELRIDRDSTTGKIQAKL